MNKGDLMRNGMYLSMIVVLVSQLTFASDGIQNLSAIDVQANDVVVPVVDSASDVKIQAGLMFYDIGSGLKIVNNLGQIENATYPNGVSSDSANERIERLKCTNVVCSTYTQSGTWVTGISNSSTGNYNVSLSGSKFSSSPTCTISAVTSSQYLCVVNSASTSNLTIECINSANTNPVNSEFNLICMGPH